MEHSKKRQRAYGLFAGVAICLAIASGCGLAIAAEKDHRSLVARSVLLDVGWVVSRTCLAELRAYEEMERVAEGLGQKRNILDFALDDLRALVTDCLVSGQKPYPQEDSNEARSSVTLPIRESRQPARISFGSDFAIVRQAI